MNVRAVAAAALAGVVAGAAAMIAGERDVADAIWATVVAVILIPETFQVLRTLRQGRVGVDAIALLAMATALIMQEYLAGAIIALMLSGGNALEDWAAGQSERELRALLGRAPREAHRIVDGRVQEVPVNDLGVGDIVSIRAGEVLPVDGVLTSERASVDEAALTGESLPVDHARGGQLRSGTSNAADPFEMRATRTAADSSYSRLIALVQSAEANRAPFVRMADRFAVYLLVITLLIGGGAWIVSGDSIRFLAVLVVATPCPLILAAPIAFIAGISRAASRGIIVKSGGAIEALGRARSVLLDKTGTLTIGRPSVESVRTAPGFDGNDVLRLAASLDQMSAHVLADSLVADARRRGLELELPSDVDETPGQGIAGRVEGRRVIAGNGDLLDAAGVTVPPIAADGEDARHAHVYVAIDGTYAGTLLLADELRGDAATLREDLQEMGIGTVAMLTGDHRQTALEIAAAAGITDVRAELTPDEKLAIVKEMHDDATASPVVMVGDGINDAPALALADVGIAMGTAGVTASAEAADAVITVPEIARVSDAISIGRRSQHIALQSVVVGIGLSAGGMAFAAAGLLPPVAGAFFQEAIDVAVILNALRALR